MGGSLSIDGLVSNLDTSSIIQQLLAVERRPIEVVQKKIAKAEEERSAFLDLSSRLLALQGTATRLGNGNIFARTKVASSNESAIKAGGSSVTSLGAFNFQVARLATIGQATSNGYTSKTSTVGAGTIVLEQGDARINRPTDLDELNGFAGVQRGKILIKDGNNNTALIDLTTAVTVQDVLDRINATSAIDVTASLRDDGEGLKLLSNVGANITVSEVGGGRTAADLGIKTAAAGAGAATLTGADVRNITRNTALALLNDGRGVNASASSPGSILINGATTVNFSSAVTVGDVIDLINASAANVVADLSADGNALTLRYTDGFAAGNAGIRVQEQGGTTARDLGLLAPNGGFDKLTTDLLSGELVHVDFESMGATTANLLLRDTGARQALVTTDAAGGVTFANNAVALANVNKGGAVIANGGAATITIANTNYNSSGTAVTGAGAIWDELLTDAGAGTKVATLALEFTGPANAGETVFTIGNGGVAGDTFVELVRSGANDLLFRLGRDNGAGADYRSLTTTLGAYNPAGANRVVLTVDYSASATDPTLSVQINAAAVESGGTNSAGSIGNLIDLSGATDSLRFGEGVALSVGGGTDGTAIGLSSFRAFNRTLTAAEIDNFLNDEAALRGRQVISAIDSALTTNLNGGVEPANAGATGVGAHQGAFRITDGAAVVTELDLNSFRDTRDFLYTAQRMTALAGQDLTLAVNATGLGFTLTDNGGSGTLTVADTQAQDGKAGATRLFGSSPVSSSTRQVEAQNLQRATLTSQTRLETLNAGKGVSLGKFRITSTSGASYTVDLSSTTDPPETVDDVLDKITAAGPFTARLNDTGDGILVIDTAGGAGTLTIDEIDGGRTAADLNLIRDANDSLTSRIDGSFEYSVTIGATDTLESLVTAIAALKLDLNAGIIDDGTGITAKRLNLVAKDSGAGGFFTAYTTGSTTLSFGRTSEGQDAAVLFGATSASTNPLLLKSHQNTVTNAVSGLTLQLLAATTAPVTVSVTRDTAGIVDEVETFAEDFNSIVERINELTAFDPDTLESGILLGDSTARRILSDLQFMVIDAVDTLPSGFNSLLNVGFRLDSTGTLSFTRSTFELKMTQNFEAVRDIFTNKRGLGLSTKVKDLNGGRGLGLVAGASPEFRFTPKSGASVDVDLTGSTFLADILSKFNAAADAAYGAGIVSIAIAASGKTLVITDTTGASGTSKLTALNNSTVLSDLRFNATTSTTSTLESSEVDVFNYKSGIGNRVADRLEFITDPIDGSLAAKSDGIDTKIEDYERQIQRLEERVAAVQQRLTREFTQLEIFLGQSQNTMQRLSQQLGAISGLSQRR